MKIHKCENMIEHEIRYTKALPESWAVKTDIQCWRLYQYELFDKGYRHICPVKYCPFCGELLNIDN